MRRAAGSCPCSAHCSSYALTTGTNVSGVPNTVGSISPRPRRAARSTESVDAPPPTQIGGAGAASVADARSAGERHVVLARPRDVLLVHSRTSSSRCSANIALASARVLAEAGERVREERAPADARFARGRPRAHRPWRSPRRPEPGRGSRRASRRSTGGSWSCARRWLPARRRARQDVLAEVVLAQVDAGKPAGSARTACSTNERCRCAGVAGRTGDRVGDQVAEGEQADIVTHAPHCGPTEAFNASRQFPGERSAPQVIGSEYRALFPPAGRHPAASFRRHPRAVVHRQRQRAATLVRCSGSSRRTPPSSGRQTAGSSTKTRVCLPTTLARRYRYEERMNRLLLTTRCRFARRRVSAAIAHVGRSRSERSTDRPSARSTQRSF